MRSFTLFVLLVAASTLAASAQAPPDPEACNPDVADSCGVDDKKTCCPNFDVSLTFSAPHRCYNPLRSDDHCGAVGTCGVRCTTEPFRRCVDGVCGTKRYDLNRIRRNCQGVPAGHPDFIVPITASPVGSVKITKNGASITAHILLGGGSPPATAGAIYRVRLIQLLNGVTVGACGADPVYFNTATSSSFTVTEVQTGNSAFLYLDNVDNTNNDAISSPVIPVGPAPVAPAPVAP